MIDTTHLKNAVSALRNSIGDYDEYASNGGSLRESLRSGVIQNFEVAYELSWKAMKRWLSFNVSPELVDGLPRFELFRYAAENGLISDLEKWFEFHKARNRTVHEYSEIAADEVFVFAKNFAGYAEEFIEKLEARL